MNSSTVIDARGLSCPEPALLTRQALQKAPSNVIIVLVDSVTSRDNVIRTAKLAKWQAEFEQQADGSFKVTISR
jgi:tRNA 2-thiouridine synthesizing protein A